MAKAPSLPCKRKKCSVFRGKRARKNLDSLAMNIILGALLLSKFIDYFRLNKGFNYWAFACNPFPVTFTRIYIYQSTSVRVFFLGYFSFDNLSLCFFLFLAWFLSLSLNGEPRLVTLFLFILHVSHRKEWRQPL